MELNIKKMVNGMNEAPLSGVDDLIVAGDSRIAILEAQRIIGCNQPLVLLLRWFETL